MTNVTAIRPQHTARELEALKAWEAARAGDGMSLKEAASILRSVNYSSEMTDDELDAMAGALSDDMIDNLAQALLIKQGSEIAHADALQAYMIERRLDA